MKKIIICLFILFSFAVLSFSCEKKRDSSIPDYDVHIETTPSEYAILSIPGNFVIYTPDVLVAANSRFGYGGVLLYRDLEGKIRACDLACPVEALPSVRVDVKMPYAECPVCGSRFDLSWGLAVPIAGPARESLRSYHANERTNSIVVSN